jgi:rfaE bifunctional protein kinase chain/domain
MEWPFHPLPSADLREILSRARLARIAVIGDFCLDAYWFLDPSDEERSLETGLPVRRVHQQRYSPGGAGNVLMNLRTLGVAEAQAFGVLGADPFGPALKGLLDAAGVGTRGLLTQTSGWSTHVYGKPYAGDEEQSRIDFGSVNRLDDSTARSLVAALRDSLSGLDAVIINEQIPGGIHASPAFADALRELIRVNPKTLFLLDSRSNSDRYPGTIRKVNEHEANRLCGRDSSAPADDRAAAEAAEELYRRWQTPLAITRGHRGCLVRVHEGLAEIPGLLVLRRTDTVGAGDSMLAGMAAALATGRDLVTASIFGGLVAGVTVQKLFQTGTATPDEVSTLGEDPDYIYRCGIAEDPRQARMWEGTDIEIVSTPPATRFTHAILDHDGTISTLRQGWEEIMRPMMVEAILGPQAKSTDRRTFDRVSNRVHEFVQKTTGMQTIKQMEGLAEMVRDFGFVPASDVLTPAEYKRRYLAALQHLVDDRVTRLRRSERSVDDFTIKNVLPFLQSLKDAGIRLYLASGTDQADVRTEAAALGYAEMFDGGIHGAVDEAGHDVKKAVVRRILAEIGSAHTLLGIGDGPVELREVHKAGGYALGLATDEIRRHGLNLEKRTRLIQAGADLVIPDYAQLQSLCRILHLCT